jgi:hypothetical protein
MDQAPIVFEKGMELDFLNLESLFSELDQKIFNPKRQKKWNKMLFYKLRIEKH